jgi:hypothetical protein
MAARVVGEETLYSSGPDEKSFHNWLAAKLTAGSASKQAIPGRPFTKKAVMKLLRDNPFSSGRGPVRVSFPLLSDSGAG